MSTSSSKPEYLPELDGLRGIAVMAVILGHCSTLTAYGVEQWLPFTHWGWLGVEIFFVLSGFLITRILIASAGNANAYKTFLVRRALRIFPAYYFVLALVWGLAPALSDPFAQSSTRGDLIQYVLYLQNWSMAQNGWPDWPYVGHFWSLAVEEQFYLVWPLVALFVPVRWLSAICLILIVCSIGFVITIKLMGGPGEMDYVSTPAQLHALCAGAWIACQSNTRIRTILDQRFVIGLVLAVALYMDLRSATLVLSSLVICGIYIQPARSNFHYAAILRSSPLRWVGKYSYGMYLLHFPILGLLFDNASSTIWHYAELHPWISLSTIFMLTLAITVSLAWLQYQLIEAPFLRLKDRTPSRLVRRPLKPHYKNRL